MDSFRNWAFSHLRGTSRFLRLRRKGDLVVVSWWLAALGLAMAATTVDPALHRAIYADRTEEALALLGDGADPNARNRYGVHPLGLACANGNADLVKALLEAGAKAEPERDRQHTSLMAAARTGKPASVRLLLEAGASVNARDRQGQTALMWAAVEGHAEAVKILLEAGADREVRLRRSGFTAWFFAAREGHLEVIEVLLGDGAEVNAPMVNGGGGGRTPRKGTSALMLAMENGHFEVAQRLLEVGADPNDLRSGYAPLHVISWVRKPVKGDGIDGAPPPRASGRVTSLQFVESLIEHGADVNLRLTRGSSNSRNLGKPGCTPFLLASRTADLPLMKLLIERGADFRIPNEQGRTPLLAAAGVALGPEADEAATEKEAMAAVEYLLEHGVNINDVDDEGDTVVHAAAYKQAPHLVRLLAEKGADIAVWNRKNKRGWTPLLIAQGFRYGNFKPSAPTIAALSEVMLARGVTPPEAPPRPVLGKREDYQN